MSILASSKALRFLTYQRSRSIFSSSESKVLPFTCAQPVIPGRTAPRARPASPFILIVSGRSGRGPTKFISPHTTLSSPGSSSRRDRRRNRPTGVVRSLSDKSSPALSLCSLIERSFRSVNGLPPAPARVCRKTTGRPMVRATSTPRHKSSGNSRTSSARAVIREIMIAQRPYQAISFSRTRFLRKIRMIRSLIEGGA